MPLNSSAADPICPTFAAGTFSVISKAGVANTINDCVAPGGANGYVNQLPSTTAGSFNNDWGNNVLTQSVTPTYSSGLLSFGNTGLQS